jgi:hypothetical protein
VERYHELVIEGRRGLAMGFVQGYLAGRELTDEVFDAEAEGVCCESFREKFREFLNPKRETVHLLVPEHLVEKAKEALARSRERDIPLTLLHERVIARLRFSYAFQVYSREHGRRIRSWFESPPEGVALSRKAVLAERIDPGAKGIEMYSPVHDYELKGKGTVEGAVRGVLEFYRLCRDEELIETGELEPILEKPAGGKD